MTTTAYLVTGYSAMLDDLSRRLTTTTFMSHAETQQLSSARVMYERDQAIPRGSREEAIIVRLLRESAELYSIASAELDAGVRSDLSMARAYGGPFTSLSQETAGIIGVGDLLRTTSSPDGWADLLHDADDPVAILIADEA